MEAARQEAPLSPRTSLQLPEGQLCRQPARLSPAPFRFRCHPRIMAAAAAAGTGAPPSPDELVPKGDAEKTEEELEEEDDDEVTGPRGARSEAAGGERPARGCGLRVLRGSGRRCIAEPGEVEAEAASPGGEIRAPVGPGCSSSRGLVVAASAKTRASSTTAG